MTGDWYIDQPWNHETKKKRSEESKTTTIATRTSKRRRRAGTTSKDPLDASNQGPSSSFFREVPHGRDAQSLTDGVRLVPQILVDSNNNNNGENDTKNPSMESIVQSRPPVILPWVGFGTYYLGEKAREATVQALQAGYRQIDTAFCYSRERTERRVGEALQQALEDGTIPSRHHVFVTTKHWRRFHGYNATLDCLRHSLKRLQLSHVDLWLMHWPGPAWKVQDNKNDNNNNDDNDDGKGSSSSSNDVWSQATTASSAEKMAHLRSETWKAMEDAFLEGKCRAIGVSNFTVQHLESLQCRIRPMVNQVELHPLHPQTELRQYCARHGIVVQAYASLGGHDTTHQEWRDLLGWVDKHYQGNRPKGEKGQKATPRKSCMITCKLLNAEPVLDLAAMYEKTPAQILLKWALQQDCVVIPKTSKPHRMAENSDLFGFSLEEDQIQDLSEMLLDKVRQTHPMFSKNTKTTVMEASADEREEGDDPQEQEQQDMELQRLTRLCWRSDPLRLLEFE